MAHDFRREILECLLRARERRARADATSDPKQRANALEMAGRWMGIARNYAFIESLTTFIDRRESRPAGTGSSLAEKARSAAQALSAEGWSGITDAPFDRRLELAVVAPDDVHVMLFPCRRVLRGWIDAETREPIDSLRPTHWREWREAG